MSISVQYYFGTYHFGTSDFGKWPLRYSRGVAINPTVSEFLLLLPTNEDSQYCNFEPYARFPPFRCYSSVAVSPFCRCKIPLFCKNYVRKFCSITAVNSKKIRNGSSNGVRTRQRLMGTAKRQRENGNRMVETSVGTVTETGTETAVFWQNRTEAKPRF